MFALSSNSIFFLLFLCPLGGIATWAFRKKDLSVFVYFNKQDVSITFRFCQSVTAGVIVKRVKTRSITFFKSVFSLNVPVACYVQREFKIVLFTEYLKSPLKETDTCRKMSGLLVELCLLLKRAKKEHQHAYGLLRFSVGFLLVLEIDTKIYLNKRPEYKPSNKS